MKDDTGEHKLIVNIGNRVNQFRNTIKKIHLVISNK